MTENPAADDPRRFAPATQRNREPILSVLREVLPAKGLVLEIAAGTGEHALFFAERLPGLAWQPSDPDAANLASIAAWRDGGQSGAGGPQNLLAPIDLDVTSEDWTLEGADAVVCINMIHIAPWEATPGLMAGAARMLAPGAPLVLYGPFRQAGAPLAPSNADFDANLRTRDPRWGLRLLEDVAAEADRAGFDLSRVDAMPAHNLCVVFTRRSD